MSKRISHIQKQPFCCFCKRVKRITFLLLPVSDFHLAEQKAVYRHGGGRLKVSQEIQLVASHCPGLNLIRRLSSRVTAENCNKYLKKRKKKKKKKALLTKVSHNSWKLFTCKLGILIKGTGIYNDSHGKNQEFAQCEKEEDKRALWIGTVRLSRGI